MKNVIKIMSAMVFAFYSATATAIPLLTVGSIDNLLAYGEQGVTPELMSSGSASEEAWIESVLGFDIAYSQLDENISQGSQWESVMGGDAGDYAFDFGLDVDPAYYIVKVGGGDGNGTIGTHFLFENIESLQWAYVNLSNFGTNVLLDNIGIISHVGVVGGSSVPEPGIVVLLAIGLLGMAVARRKMKV